MFALEIIALGGDTFPPAHWEILNSFLKQLNRTSPHLPAHSSLEFLDVLEVFTTNLVLQFWEEMEVARGEVG